MFVAIRQLKVQSGSIDEAVRRVENGLVPLLRSVPGFVEYDVVQVGEDVGLTISVFETQEQAEESNIGCLSQPGSTRLRKIPES